MQNTTTGRKFSRPVAVFVYKICDMKIIVCIQTPHYIKTDTDIKPAPAAYSERHGTILAHYQRLSNITEKIPIKNPMNWYFDIFSR